MSSAAPEAQTSAARRSVEDGRRPWWWAIASGGSATTRESDAALAEPTAASGAAVGVGFTFPGVQPLSKKSGWVRAAFTEIGHLSLQRLQMFRPRLLRSGAGRAGDFAPYLAPFSPIGLPAAPIRSLTQPLLTLTSCPLLPEILQVRELTVDLRADVKRWLALAHAALVAGQNQLSDFLAQLRVHSA